MTLTFETLRLVNVRSYDDQTVSFEPGENLVFGSNGAGKSTILQGVFGGLFQTSMKYHVGRGFDLADLIRKGCEEGRIVLSFSVDGDEYTVDWRIEKTYDDDGAVDGAKTKSGYPQLSSEALAEDLSQVGTVGAEIRRLIGMDAESFVNSVYIQQGDITRLIHAGTETRREILDGLLGLNHIDDLVERMDAVRLEYGKAKRDATAKRTEAANRLADLPEQDDLQTEIGAVAGEITETKEDLAETENTLERLHEEKSETETTLDRIDDLEAAIEEKREKLDEAEDDHERHKKRLEDERTEKRDAENELDEKRDALSTLRERDVLGDDDLSTKDAAERAHDDARSAAESARSRVQSIEEGTLSTLAVERERLEDTIADIEGDIESTEERLELAEQKRKNADERRSAGENRVAELEAELTERREAVTDRAGALDVPRGASLDALARSHIPEKRRTLGEEREAVREKRGRLDTLEAQVDELAAAGECPVCGASEEAHDIDAESVAAEHKNELTKADDRLGELRDQQDRLDDLEERVHAAFDTRDDRDDAREAVADAREAVEDAETRIDEHESERDALGEKRAEKEDELDAKRDEHAETVAKLETARERVEEAESRERVIREVLESYGEIEACERAIAQHERTIETVRELRRGAHDRLRDLEGDIEDLTEDLGEDDPETLRANIEKYDEHIAEFERKTADAEERIEELTGRLAGLNQTKSRVRTERERRSMLDEQVTWAGERHDEAAAVMDKYREVRGKLRKRNLAKLTQYTNEMFADLYRSQSYRGVQIDKHYDIRLIAADGELVEPELSSGGESTILNLALRAGVYRIIAERDGVAGSALPPFVLDEPTTYLDSDHVGELRTMIKTIAEWNVPQVLVVSHDETLIENSDHAILVEKDPETETSRVREGHASVSSPAQGEPELADD